MRKIAVLCVRTNPPFRETGTKTVTDDLELYSLWRTLQYSYSSRIRLHTRPQLARSPLHTSEETVIGCNLPPRVVRTESVELDNLPEIQTPPSSSVRMILLPCLE